MFVALLSFFAGAVAYKFFGPALEAVYAKIVAKLKAMLDDT